MDYSVQNWVLTGTLVIISAILGYIIQTITQQILKRLDTMVEELKVLSRTTTSQEERLKYLHEMHIELSNRLNSHSDRLHKIESRNDK